MRTWGYIWHVILNLIGLSVVFKLLTIGYETFEKAVILLLIFIYVSLCTYFSSQALGMVKVALLEHTELKKIRKLLNHEETEEEKEDWKQGLSQIKYNENKYWISVAFNTLIYIILAYNFIIL